MPRKSSHASVEIDIGAEPKANRVALAPDEPFRILVVGNFSGGAGRNRRPIGIDRDNFDQVLALIAPEIQVPAGGGTIPIGFKSMDDFHPDSLFERLGPFEALRGLRQRLANPATFQAAAHVAPPPPPETPNPDPELANLSGAELLRRMTGEHTSAAPPAAARRSDWDQMLHELTAPYATPKEDPRQPDLIARTDAAIEGEMRALLHRPDFQNLEAAWRGLYFLVRHVNTGENLKIHVMDLSQEELATGLGDLSRTLAGDSWAVIAGLYYFGREDEELLARLAGLAQEAGAPLIAGLAPDIVGLGATFDGVRRSLKANWIGLTLPRFLLRLPYGKETSETESFAFEEMPAAPEHESYLWGHPALACAALLADAFEVYGWEMRPGAVLELDGLPLHVYKQEGESVLKPCAEVLMTEAAAELLLERGFMPLASVKGTDRVRLVRFQSIAHPSAPLAGKWE